MTLDEEDEFIQRVMANRDVMFHKCLTPKSVTIRSYKQQK
jgi:hypothetical protein